jgi:hypothetical protein
VASGGFVDFSVMPRLERGIQLDPPVKPGGDKKNAPSVKTLWAGIRR